MIVDTHCHLTMDALAPRVDQVIDDAVAAGVTRMITVCVTSENAMAVQALASRRPEVWCSAGVHPLYSHHPVDWAVIRDAANHPRCVAWGEMGLDNHYEEPPRSTQDRILAEQVALIESAQGEGVRKPCIIHCREAFDDLLAVLGSSRLDPARCVFHCFTGGPDDARRVLDFGAMISFTGIATFRSAAAIAEAARLTPADRIMIETDAPFLTPEPHRKTWPNEPRFLRHTAAFLAAQRGESLEAFSAATTANAERFFGLGG